MKKSLLIFFALLILSIPVTQNASAADNAKSPTTVANENGYSLGEIYEPEGAINYSSETGQIMYEYKIDAKWYPASMSKLMTLYLTEKAINSGKLDKNAKVKMTNEEYRLSTLPELSNTKLYPGDVYTISELMQITVSNSSNAGAMILGRETMKAENLASAKKIDKKDKDSNKNTASKQQKKDLDSDFVDYMNETAKKIGMKHTKFYNSNGASNNLLLEYKAKRYQSDEDNYSTSRDFAILAQHLVKQYPDILEYTKLVAPTVQNVTYYTYNHSLEGADMSLKGTDGLKTGSSDTADYNHSLSTKRDGLRINQIILGAGDYNSVGGEKERNMMGNSLMEKSFNEYEWKKVLSKGKQKINGKTYYVSEDLYDVVQKGVDYKVVLEDGKAHIDYKRTFLNDSYGPPTVNVESPSKHKFNQTKEKVTSEDNRPIIMTASILLILGILLLLTWLLKRKKNNK
ncbi:MULTISPECIES: penicillin-binding protein PBP4 [Mammaliicoccus]|uniref:penicillin-binding protein PBP4 n=1 Tax=Mammaliicoccus TaxID=2803850 RepID=UPI00099297CA|nr:MULTISPECIES: penicillin-binding protein PBP4 [Mammaliicoccus]MBO3061607.1 penicillin-binding protein PBP4 [Mammaliicoccus fleurettii]MEB7724024.1 penicillin-binding protein PBP4 [Mammaliicoccus fleurettii]MEB7779747.1 penicillin-binding protein PBP4 [Mammaliicoccus fleurettii]MEB8068208.1 penicillin-binding protein PBP4 [Mammaliicoccus fleurettii]OOV76122.1 D-alanyl-D-alanine carboxypeptidase [Mammaliicoccus fleurettii]